MEGVSKSTKEGNFLYLSEIQTELHVKAILNSASAISQDGKTDAATLLRIIVDYNRNFPDNSNAFNFIGEILSPVSISFKIDYANLPSAEKIIPTDKLFESFNKSKEILLGSNIWGRDLVTIILLSKDESLYELVADAGLELELVQDEWYRFVTEGRNKEHRPWEKWWSLANVLTPENRQSTGSGEVETYLFTWNPTKYNIEHLATYKEIIEKEGKVELPWSSGARLYLQVNDNVYLLRQGQEPRGIVGHGKLLDNGTIEPHWDPEKAKEGKMYNKVNVEWDYLDENPLLNLEELNNYLGNTKLWVTQAGGVKIPGTILSRLDLIWTKKINGESLDDLVFSQQHGGIAFLDSDSVRVGAIDHLNVENEAHAFARVAASKDVRPPLSIGVFGEWGSGKTFFMEKIREHIDKLQKASKKVENSAFHSKIVQIKFNAWHYMETNLWASLVDHIFREMNNWLVNKEDEDKVEQSKIDELYERLSTSRNLQLDAIKNLIQTNRRVNEAEEKLNVAKKELSDASVVLDSLSLKDYLKIINDVTSSPLDKSSELNDALSTLGIENLQNSVKDFRKVLIDIREQKKKGSLLINSIIQKFKRTKSLTILVAILLALPVGLSFLLGLIPKDSIIDINKNVVLISSVVSGITVWLGKALKVGSDALVKLTEFDLKLENAIKTIQEEKLQKNPTAKLVIRYNQEYEERIKEVKLAETRYQLYLDDYESARVELDEQKASSRLNRFIRNKIIEGNYAKHLGIIAAVRKDFEELTAIMMDLSKDKDIQENVDNQRNEYVSKLEEVLHGLEPEKDSSMIDKINEIKDSFKASTKDNMNFFQRIVLYIDDLDRCPPKKVIEVLQACHLLLYFPLFIVVVAVDARWVSHALLEEYKGLLGGESNNHEEDTGQVNKENSASPRDYLEKIFQVPYWVRRMQGKDTKDFTVELLGKVKEMPKPSLLPRKASTSEKSEVKTSSSATPKAEPKSTEGKAAPAKTGGSGSLSISKSSAKSTSAGTKQQKSGGEEHINLNPESLQITSYERDYLRDLSPFAGDSPRTIKRFVNLYKLLKAGLPQQVLDGLVGKWGESMIYKAIIAQLAIVTGAPTIAVDYFNELVRLDKNQDELDITTPSLMLNTILQLESIQESKERDSVVGPVESLVKQADNIEMLKTMVMYANVVKRYSFSARPFLY